MLRTGMVVFLSVLLLAGMCFADTVVLNNKDILYGKFLNKTVEMKSPYGALTIDADMILGLFTGSTPVDDDEVETLNHDFFSGTIISDIFEFATAAGQTLTFRKADIKRVKLDNRAVTREIETTLFFMANGDKFSGRLREANLSVKTGYAEKDIPSGAMRRIEFGGAVQTAATVHLNNGSLFKGDIMEKRLLVRPDSTRDLSICIGKIAAIQFNVIRLIAGKSGAPGGVFDIDGDGVPDSRDDCPDTACGFVTDASGCRPMSDTDQDGIDDASDSCAGTPLGVHADSNGCWVIQSALFGTNRAVIDPDFYMNLDEVARILERNPDLKIEVQGHADTIGSAEYNLKLTQSRARAVVAYLVGQGIDRSRLMAIGYGFSRPRASNDTQAGRALNRRVELVPISE